MLPMDHIGGIPGLNLELRREKYIRRNMEPVFMTERSPSRNRVDVWDLMKDVGLDHYDRLEWLIRTDTRYTGDDLYVIRYEDPEEHVFSAPEKKDAVESCEEILSALGSAGEITISNAVLDYNSCVCLGQALRYILLSNMKANPYKSEHPVVGRRKKELDRGTLEWAHNQLKSNLKTSDQISDELGVSRSTLFRRLKEAGYRSEIIQGDDC
ncbi:MAG: hypothetical protein J5813_07290 [Candidatus Methanomethylophilaceae archaeon]|nr:hypothetical protein [Candidatus Methanomethylophilaceae archaeon]